jgi:hypothetical protein
MRRVGQFVVLLLFSVLATGVAAHAGGRVALVIGNSAYQHTVPLANPRNDAADIGAALEKLGFQVIEGLDLDKAAFDRKVAEYATAMRGAAVGLFFYAGHGLQVDGQNYLVPVDASADTAAALDFQMVRLDLVQRTMEREAQTNILFLDACRDNPLARNLARGMGTRSTGIGRGLAAAESGAGTLISFSTQPGNVALDGAGRNSPYAGALIRQVAGSGEDLSAILIAVRNDVMTATQRRQVPWEHSSLTGRFYFGLGPPAPGGPSADELSWDLIKDTKDPAQLRRFIEQFPDSRRRPEAERKAAALAAPTRPAEPPKKAPSTPVSQPAAAPSQVISAPPSPTASAPPGADQEALRTLSDLVNLGVTARDAMRAREKAAAPAAAPIATDVKTAPGRPAAAEKPIAPKPSIATVSPQRAPAKAGATHANCQQMAQQYQAAVQTVGAPGTIPQLLSMYQYLQCNCGYPPSPQLPACSR